MDIFEVRAPDPTSERIPTFSSQPASAYHPAKPIKHTMPLSSCMLFSFAASSKPPADLPVVPTQPVRIAIVGAGPAGLTLARLLQKKQRELQASSLHPLRAWEVTIYEAYKLGSGTREGGSLDLRQGTGLSAIAAAGLMPEYLAKARLEGQDLRVMNMAGDMLYREYEDDADAESSLFHPEIDRGDLNQILRESLEPGTIRWEHKLVSMHRCADSDDAQFRLGFANGEQAFADLVVGADGAWSRVRPLLSPEVPAYSGTTFLDCTLYDFDARYPELADFVGKGSLYAFSKGRVLFTQRNGKGILRVYIGFQASEDWSATPDIATVGSDVERAELLLKRYYSDWRPEFQQLVRAAGEQAGWRCSRDGGNTTAKTTEMAVRPLYELHVGHSWENQRGVTLIGDAAHLMSPCAGEGVNMAMADALGLAEAIIAAVRVNEGVTDALEAQIGKFETEMFARAKEAAAISKYALREFMEDKEATRADAERLFDRSTN